MDVVVELSEIHVAVVITKCVVVVVVVVTTVVVWTNYSCSF